MLEEIRQEVLYELSVNIVNLYSYLKHIYTNINNLIFFLFFFILIFAPEQ